MSRECELMLLFLCFISMVARERKFYFLNLLQTEQFIKDDESKETVAARRIYPVDAVCVAFFLRLHCT